MSGSVVISSGARVFASEVEPPAPRLSVATAQRSPARKSLRFICSYCWLAGRLGSVKAVASLLFHLLPRSDAKPGRARRRCSGTPAELFRTLGQLIAATSPPPAALRPSSSFQLLDAAPITSRSFSKRAPAAPYRAVADHCWNEGSSPAQDRTSSHGSENPQLPATFASDLAR